MAGQENPDVVVALVQKDIEHIKETLDEIKETTLRQHVKINDTWAKAELRMNEIENNTDKRFDKFEDKFAPIERVARLEKGSYFMLGLLFIGIMTVVANAISEIVK